MMVAWRQEDKYFNHMRRKKTLYLAGTGEDPSDGSGGSIDGSEVKMFGHFLRISV